MPAAAALIGHTRLVSTEQTRSLELDVCLSGHVGLAEIVHASSSAFATPITYYLTRTFTYFASI